MWLEVRTNYPGCIRQIDELVATGSIQEVYTIDV